MSVWFYLTSCAEPPGDSPAPAELAASATQVPVEERADIIGLVIPLVDEELSAGAGGRLAELHVGLGDEVVVGQPLARLSSPELAHRIARAQARATATLSERRAAVVRAAAAAEESAALSGLDGAVAKRDQEQALALARERELDADALAGKASEASAELELLKTQSDALLLTSQRPGKIAAIYKRLGENVEAGEAVFRVISSAQIVRFAVDASVPLRAGGSVGIVTIDGRSTRATVARIAPSIDSAGMLIAETSVLTENLQIGDSCRLTLEP